MSFINKTFDDSDNSTLVYEGFWFRIGTYLATSTGESGTLSSTSAPNASVTLTFPSPAIAFYIYGIKRSHGGRYGVCVDCDPRNQQFIPIDGVNATDDGKNPPTVLYSQRFEKPGSHVVILQNEQDERFGGNSQLAFDRIDLEIPDPNGGANASSSTSASAAGATSPTATGKPATVNPGAIVGGVLGGLVLIALILVTIFFRVRRQRQNKRSTTEDAIRPPGPSMSTFSPVSQSATNGSGVRPFYVGSEGEMSTVGTSSVGGWTAVEKGRPVVVKPPRSSSREWAGNTSQPNLRLDTNSVVGGSTVSGRTNTNYSSASGPSRAVDAGPLSAGTLPPEYGNWAAG